MHPPLSTVLTLDCGSTNVYYMRDEVIATEVAERFWSNVSVGSADGCWPWRLSTARGYGQVWIDGRNRKASHVALILSGQPRTDRNALHSCDNPICCNPAHLSWGTQAKNRRESAERGRAARGERVSTARLTERDVLSIRSSPVSPEELARTYGVAQSTVYAVLRRRTWRHV